MKLKLSNVRINFPVLFEPKKFANDAASKAAFSASFLVPKTSPMVKQIEAAILEAAKEKWGAKAAERLKLARSKDNVFFRDGDLKAEDYPEQEGHMLASTRTYNRPLVIGADKSPLTEAEGKIYSGCYVNVSFDIWAQDFRGVPRINAQLQGVQFSKDGDAFVGGRAASPEEFDDVSDVGGEGEEDLTK